MNQSLLNQFGNSSSRVERAIESLKSGNGVILVDDEDRENEGDLIFSASTITTAQMAMLIRECSGIVCLCLTDQKASQLGLPPMVSDNTSKNQTAFTVSIEAKHGVSTGVSAADRVTTVKAAISDDCKPSDLARPGHVFPLRSHREGLSQRKGHTEGTLELMRLSNLPQAGLLCELTHVDGSMMRLPALIDFSIDKNIPILSIEDLLQYRLEAA